MIHRIAAAGYVADVDDAGATLRGLSYDGRDLVLRYPDERRVGYLGAVLVPWPNRLHDGAYEVDGVAYQAPITEVERGHALHGLVCWTAFQPTLARADEVRLRTVVPVQPGYPTALAVEVGYRLGAGGLEVTVTARNVGAGVAPYGVGQHPYLVAGSGRVDAWTLTLPATHTLEADERMIPTGRVLAVDEAGCDLRAGRRLAGVELDHCFTGVGDGEVVARLVGDDGRGAEIVADGSWARWWQVFTGQGLPEPLLRRGVAVEPMSCPPDAFHSGEGLVRLAPGETHQASWTIRTVPI